MSGHEHEAGHTHGPDCDHGHTHSADSAHTTHSDHQHTHGPGCGHLAVQHAGHTDYLHDSHLHHLHDGHVDEHKLEVSATNPAACTPSHACGAHDAAHSHGANCGHQSLPHGDHVDYIVAGHLHHPHNGHCDDHGAVVTA